MISRHTIYTWLALLVGAEVSVLLAPHYIEWVLGSPEQNYGMSIAPDPVAMIIRGLIPIIGLIILIWILNSWLSPKEDQRKLCPHFNVDGDGKCNLLPESEECKGYCRTLGVWMR